MFFDEEFRPKPYTNGKGKARKPGSKDLHSMISTKDKLFIDLIEVNRTQ